MNASSTDRHQTRHISGETLLATKYGKFTGSFEEESAASGLHGDRMTLFRCKYEAPLCNIEASPTPYKLMQGSVANACALQGVLSMTQGVLTGPKPGLGRLILALLLAPLVVGLQRDHNPRAHVHAGSLPSEESHLRQLIEHRQAQEYAKSLRTLPSLVL